MSPTHHIELRSMHRCAQYIVMAKALCYQSAAACTSSVFAIHCGQSLVLSALLRAVRNTLWPTKHCVRQRSMHQCVCNTPRYHGNNTSRPAARTWQQHMMATHPPTTKNTAINYHVPSPWQQHTAADHLHGNNTRLLLTHCEETPYCMGIIITHTSSSLSPTYRSSSPTP
jgi:hypothetical protein